MQEEMEEKEKEHVDRLQKREEREKEYVARLQAGEEKYAAEMELVHVHYEEDLWGTQMRMKEIYKDTLQKKGLTATEKGVTSENVKAEQLTSPKVVKTGQWLFQ